LSTSWRQKGSRCSDTFINELRTRWTWEVSLTYRPLYPPKKPQGNHRTGGKLGLRDCLEVWRRWIPLFLNFWYISET
jgi:hypothetical protein